MTNLDDALDRLLATGDAAALRRLRAGIDIGRGHDEIIQVDDPARFRATFDLTRAYAAERSSETVDMPLDDPEADAYGRIIPTGDALLDSLARLRLVADFITSEVKIDPELNYFWNDCSTSIDNAITGLEHGLEARILGRRQAVLLIRDCMGPLPVFAITAEERGTAGLVSAIDRCGELLDTATTLVHRLFDASEDGSCAPARR
jgi:hypothetical protein